MSRRLIPTWTVLVALFLTISLSVLQSHATPAKTREGFDAGFTLTQTVGAHADWYDGGAGPVVTEGSGVAGSVGLAPATDIFTWAAYPFGWSAAEFRGVILQMDFQSDSSAKFYDDRIGWMTTDGNIDPANFFGVQLDNSQGGGIVTCWQDGSGASIHTPIAALTGIKADTWYRFQAVIKKLTGTSARIDVSLVELDAGGNRTGTPITGTVSDTGTWPGGAPDAKYFTAATLWPAYKHFTAMQGSADNAFVATLERFAFVVTTDWHTSGAQPAVENNLQQVRSWIISPTPDMPAPAFMVITGDFPNWYQTQASIDTVLGSGFLWYPVIGNHEIDDGIANFNYLRDTMVPSLPYIVNYGPTGSANTSYSWDYSNAHFVAVNAYWDGTTNPNADHSADGDIRPQLRTWIDTDLADSGAPRRFVFVHEPAYPDTRHVGDSLDKYPANRDAFIGTLNSHEVETLFCGHTHYYEHDVAPEYPLGTVHQVTNGTLSGTGATITYVLVDSDSVTYKVYQGGSSSPFEQWTIGGDSTAPSVTIDQAVGQGDPASASPINFTAVFSTPVTGFGSSGVTIGGTAGGTKSVVVTGGGTTYNVAVSGMTNGTITASVAANAAQDAAGNRNIASTSTDNTVTYDSTAPTVTNVTSSTANGTYGAGAVIDVRVTFSETVSVTGAPQLLLETGTMDRNATYASGSGSSVLIFNYTVQAGDTSADLEYVAASSLTLNGGTNTDAAGNSAILTLPSPGAAGSLGNNKNIVIAGVTTISVAPTAASVAASGTQQFTATARDQFGALLVPQPSFTWTVSGGGAIASSGLFTAGSTAGGPYTVTAASGGVSGTASVTVTGASTVTMGETAILGTNSSGSANMLVAQQASLGQSATPVSLSVYVATASGTLRLGVYDATGPNGGPGQLRGQTAAFTPISGWNTQAVVSPVVLPAGTYWLAYLPSSSSLALRRASTGSARGYSYPSGAMPATFSQSPTSGTYHWSFYATLQPALPTLTTISVAPTAASVAASGTQQFTATARDQFGALLVPQPSFTWTVSGGGTIASSGLFTAGSTAGGPYTVTAASGGVSGTASVTVTVPPTLTTISVAPTAASVAASGTQQFTATARDQFGALLVPQPSFTWTVSGGGTIASSGLFTAGSTAGGPYTVTAASGGVSGTASVTVTVPPTLTTISVAPTAASVAASGTQQFTATARDQFGALLVPQPSFTWTVSGGGTIASSGLFTAGSTAGGPYTVTAASGGVSGTASVTVTVPPTLTTISVAPTAASVAASGTQQFTATARDQFGALLVPQPSFTWTVSGGGTIASSGLFTAGSTAGGPYTVTAASGGVSGTASVTVTVPPTLTTISVAPTAASVAASGTQQFTATARDQFGALLVPQPSFTWTVSGGGTIASSGLFTAGSTAGGPYTVTAASGGVSGTASVTVTVPPTLTTISVAPTAASVAASGTQQFTATARDQFGALLVPQPSFTWTVSGGGTIASSGLFTAGSTAGGPYTVTAASGGVSGTASVTVTGASTVTMGETAILGTNSSGSANMLVAQQASLGQSATPVSLSVYVATASGTLRLGVYDATGPNGGPGQLRGQTAAFTPISGWNTQAVVSPVVLPAGTYWLAYLPSSSSLALRRASTGSARGYSYPSGAMPATFSQSPTSGTYHWSFYATLQPALPTLTTISVAPTAASVAASGTQQFTATARDQFGALLVPQPSFTWTVSGGGAIASSGLFTAGSTAGGPYTVTAASGGVSGTASVTVTASTIAVNDFADYRVFQRDIGGTSKSVTISGTYSNMNWNRVEGRVLQHDTDTAVVNWATIDSTPGGGIFSGNLTVPQGGWYDVEIRALDAAGSVIGSSRGTNKWGVGMLILCIGQSNMVGKGQPPFTIATSDLAVNYSNAGRWEHLADPYDDESPAGAVDNDNSTAAGSMIPALANSLLQTFNFPIAFVPSAKDGSNLYSQWAYRNPSNHYDTSTLYGQSITKAQSVGGVELIIMHQGEADTNAHRTEAQYEADFATMIGNYRQDLYATIPIFICQLGTISIEGGDPRTDADVVAVRSAQHDLDNGVNIFMAATAMDQPRMDDVHYTRPGFNAIGGRIGQAIKYYLGATSYYRGPEILSVFFADANRNTVDVEITHRGGNDITPVSGITGFSLLSNGLPVGITSADRMSADRIRLTLASAIPQGAATTLRYLWGSNPDTGALVKDNEPLALPLENTTADITVTDMPLP